MLNELKWLVLALIMLIAPQVGFAQQAPTGEHYAGRATDTGYGGTFVNATGNFAASIPLNLPPARAGLPVPLEISYGGRGVGAAGLGWDIPLSYIMRERTLAHRRGAALPAAPPVGRLRTSISLLGQNMELVPQGDAWVARFGTLALTVRESAGSWLAYDGKGRTYVFTRPAYLNISGLWLLTSVNVAGGASVQISYGITLYSHNYAEGNGINLARITYNTHPSVGCAKNEVTLTYGTMPPAGVASELAPGVIQPGLLSISMSGNKVLVRRDVLKLIDVNSRATCALPYQRLRRYEFQYLPDADTRLPRLRAVHMFGREGTPEENISLPVAAYDYGTATTGGALRYKATQPIDLPPGADHLNVSGTSFDSSVVTPASGSVNVLGINVDTHGVGYAMWQALTDVTGDGRPDLVFKKNNKLWVAFNRPAPDGQTTLGAGGGQAIAQLSDTTFANGAFSIHASTQRRFWHDASNRNTVDIWRKAIDVNGDGRIDIVDAAEQPDRWVVYLNTPGGPTGIKWERRSFSVHKLRQALFDGGHVIYGDYLPLSRRATGTDLKVAECWRWDGTQWDWYSEGFSYHLCPGFEGQVFQRGPERTFVEWELNDLNGDGYPDFVFDSAPVDFQVTPPPVRDHPKSIVGEIEPRDNGAGPGNNYGIWHPFHPRLTNRVQASFNVLGVRFYTDDDPFSQPVDMGGGGRSVGEWGCTGLSPDTDFPYYPYVETPCHDDGHQSQLAGFVDVNGDGLVDYVYGNGAFLGAYAGASYILSYIYLPLPGPLATEYSTHKEQCSGGAEKPTADQEQGLRDLTGDGIPDYYDKGLVRIGTGVGFAPPIHISAVGASFRFSHETESCNGDISNTDGGLFDIDGDGRPEIIGIVKKENGQWAYLVSQLAGGSVPGVPEAGRLTGVDNGYGATTHISFRSAKEFTDSPVPFPEIVVSSIETTGTRNLGGTLSAVLYAYGNAELIFDSMSDRFVFPGYRRTIELQPYGSVGDEAGVTQPASGKGIGAATIVDTWPLSSFNTAMTKPERWRRMQLVGRLRDTYMLHDIAAPDPWALLNVFVSDPRVIGVTHYEWDAKLLEVPASPNATVVDCLEMVKPLDFQVTLADIGANGLDVCRASGFAFGLSSESWYGGSPPPSTNNLQTRSRVLTVDEFGRVTSAQYENDVFRGDDDICVENTFASPNATYPRVLSALASRRLYACGKNTTFASESFTYDGLPAGGVSLGRMTSHTVDRRGTVNGELLSTMRAFDATYDAAGNLATVRAQRDGATRTVRFNYDSFGIAPTNKKVDATGLPSTESSVSYDPISLQPLSSRDIRQTQRGIDFDGFGRPIRSTITPPGGALGAMSATSYLGFDGADPDGRRITVKRFSDPLAPANVATAAGQTATVFLDEIGRERRSELALGSDYANEVLVVGSRTYDSAGQVVFAADPYPKSQNAATAYGTSYHFKNTGDLNCTIRGRGPQALNMETDAATERFPTCFQRSFVDHVETLDMRDAASLQAGAPQEGIVRRVVSTAIGRVIERSTLRAGVRLDYAAFGYDQLGQQTSIIRFLDPAGATNPVEWSLRLDSIGQTLQLTEPETATRSFTYSDWGEPVETRWTDGAIERRIVRKYDALGRLIASAEQNDGVTDPETVNTYAYDASVNLSPLVTPTFVLGELAGASSPSGQVAFGYDAFGRENTQAFTDNQGGLYIEKAERHGDGRLASLGFNLPDQNYGDELVKYGYDSAGQLRSMKQVDASGARELYSAEIIDPFGRVRKALYGGNTVFHADYADEGRRLVKEASVGSPLGSRRVIFQRFDPLGRELSRREIKDGAASGPKTNVSYDALGRLAFATQSDGPTPLFDWSFAYDALGNITALTDVLGMADATLKYRDIDRDRICRIDYGNLGPGPTGNLPNWHHLHCNVVHDAVGNLVSEPTRTGSRLLTYFSSGMIRTITEQDAQARFAYDAFGQVQRLDIQGGTTQDQRHDRRFGGLIEKREVVSGGATQSLITRHIPGPGGILASRRGPANDWVFGFGELRGNRYFTNQDGAFVQSVEYQPFGEASSKGASAGTTDYTGYQWNGGDALAAFGVSQLGARIYDPVIGRFLSRDPLMVARTAATANPYTFAMNDPLNAADPSGLDCGGLCLDTQYTPDNNSSNGSAAAAAAAASYLVSKIIGSIFGDSGVGQPGAPPVSAGPHTPAGMGLMVASIVFNGYAPGGLNYDAYAGSPASTSDKLDALANVASPERDAFIDAYNAPLDTALSISAGYGDTFTFWCPGCAAVWREASGIHINDPFAYGVSSVGGTVLTLGLGTMGARGGAAVQAGAVEGGGTAAASRLGEAGGLTVSESAGGHLLARHVAKSESELAARLAAQPNIPAASTFVTRAEAEAAVAEAFDVNASSVTEWVNAGANGRLALNAPFSGGLVLQRGAAAATEGSGVLVILKGNGAGEYFILTGYPTP